MNKALRIFAVVMVVGCSGVAARGEFIRNLGVGLAGAGFDVQGGRNILSGGVDFLVNNNFTNDVFRFGVGELRLQGPISLDISTGTRFMPTLDVSFRTALDRDGNTAPLNYSLTADVGAQETAIVGSMFIDGNVSLNAFGFYDVEFTYSSRQTVTNEGNIADNMQEYDLDLGPTVISGNIFADVLVALTDPIFASAGIENPFASLSGSTQLKQILEDAARDAQALAGSQQSLASSIITGPTRDDFQGRLTGFPGASETTGAAQIVPEPAMLLLMLACIPLFLYRRAASYR